MYPPHNISPVKGFFLFARYFSVNGARRRNFAEKAEAYEYKLNILANSLHVCIFMYVCMYAGIYIYKYECVCAYCIYVVIYMCVHIQEIYCVQSLYHPSHKWLGNQTKTNRQVILQFKVYTPFKLQRVAQGWCATLRRVFVGSSWSS